MQTVLITGIDGFTGRHLAPLLSAAGHEVHGLVQRMPSSMPEGVAHIGVADLVDAEAVRAVVAAVRPDRVVHLAAIANVASTEIRSMYLVNMLGTRNLLEALVSAGSHPATTLLASSANIYGNAREGALDESVPAAPANDYAVSKAAMEAIAGLYAGRLPLIVCRPFNYTGVGQSESFLLPKIVSHAQRRAPAIELGNTDVARDFSDVRDVVRIYAALLDAPGAVGGTFNVCSGRAQTLREVLGMVERLSGHRMEIRVNPTLVRANEVRILRGDRSRLDTLLPDLPPPRPLEDTLRWMLGSPHGGAVA